VGLAGRGGGGGAEGGGGIGGGPGHPPDHRPGPAGGIPARRVRARKGIRGPHRPSPTHARGSRALARLLLALHPRLRSRGPALAAPISRRAPLDGRKRCSGRPQAVNASFQTALEALYGLERRRTKHDLIGITALLRALGDPQRGFRAIHVAGTNGKGSVCAWIERVLRAAGVRTGLFTSPHLVDFRERIRVAGRWADETRLAQ